jgi:hypothetical protein
MGRSHRRRSFFVLDGSEPSKSIFPLVVWSHELPRTLFESSRIARRHRGRFLHLSRWLARSTDAPFLLGAARGAHSRRISAPSRDRELPKREFPRWFRCLRSPQFFSRVRAPQETRSASAQAPTPQRRCDAAPLRDLRDLRRMIAILRPMRQAANWIMPSISSTRSRPAFVHPKHNVAVCAGMRPNGLVYPPAVLRAAA